VHTAVTSTLVGHPRPDAARLDEWASLDGEWEFIPDPLGVLSHHAATNATAERIAVPGNWEQGASGGRHDWLEHGWYRRRIDVPTQWTKPRVILTIGAVFHSARAWMNGSELGSSSSGWLPWEVDVTDALRGGSAVLVVRVSSPRDKRDLVHGKQRSIPYDDYNGCDFTPSSGIWGSVWIEARPATHAARVLLTPTQGLDGFHVDVEIAGPTDSLRSARIEPDGEGLEPVELTIEGNRARGMLRIPAPRLWSPDDPHLYFADIRVSTGDSDDDVVRVYSGLRSIATAGGRILLNGEPLYIRGVLDQGYWPGGGLAAPSEASLLLDLELARDAGFNLVRKHLKPEDPRWLYHADRLGILVWAEAACLGRHTPAGAAAFRNELQLMLRRDANHPSIIIWSAYNEEWGLNWALPLDPEVREAAVEAYRLLKSEDPTRLAVDNSGWNHVESDLLDWHNYHNARPELFGDAAAVIVEGGAWDLEHSPRYPTPAHLMWDGSAPDPSIPVLNSEYGGGWDSVERSWQTRWQTQYLRLLERNQGYVFTELYDIEAETVGVYTFDRRTKDQDGFEQHWVHADTVIAPLLRPVKVGADVIVATGETLTFDVRISHHGTTSLTGRLRWRLDEENSGSIAATVDPWELTKPIRVTHTVKRGGRLELVFEVDGADIARTYVDVATELPTTNIPADTGWRPEFPVLYEEVNR
jgi:hypothetical protein